MSWSEGEWPDSTQSEEKWFDDQAQPKKYPKTSGKGNWGKEGSGSSSWETRPGLQSYWSQKPKFAEETGKGGWTSSETETQGKGGTVSTDGIPNEDAVSHITAHEFLDAANLFDVGIRLEPEGLSRNIAQRAMFRIC